MPQREQIEEVFQEADLPNLAELGQAVLAEIASPAFVGAVVRIAVVLGLAVLAYLVLRIFTRRLERESDETDPVRKRLREQRAQTVASLLNTVGRLAIVLLAILMVLETFIEIGPLLAGVGVLGLAVSFGAQSLVKDLISGTFMLLEGQFAIGDVIRVGTTAGMVEKINLRTTVLRDLHGVVHVIPNGSIEVLSNLTKSWSKAVLDIGVAYKEDVDHVMEVMMDVGRDMLEDPDWRPLIMEEPEMVGVDAFADSAVMIRIAFKTLPLKQWQVGREYRRRLKNRFDEVGIEIPFPHRTFYWGEGQAPSELRDGMGSAEAGEPAATGARDDGNAGTGAG